MRYIFHFVLISAIFFSCQTKRVDSLQDVLTAISPGEQEETIDPSIENVIDGKKGTKIYLPENAFVFNDGSLPAGKVTVTLTEYYSTSDLISNRLGTVSEGRLLETGGMINFTARADGRELEINKTKSYAVAFPNKDTAKRMESFSGTTDSAGLVNWRPLFSRREELDASVIDSTLVDSSMYETRMAVCGYLSAAGGNIDWILQHPDSTIFTYVEKKFPTTDPSVADFFCKKGLSSWMKVFINTNGKVTRIDFDTKPYDSIPTPALVRRVISDFLKSLPPFDMKSMGSNTATDGYDLKFCCYHGLDWDEYNRRFKEKYSKYRDNVVEKMGSQALNYYILSFNRLGWINCDRFLYDEGDRTDLIVNITEANGALAFITFSEIKSIMQGTETNGSFTFKNIPVNSKVKLIGISYKDGKPLLSKIQLVVTKQPVTLSGFKEFPLKELEKQINEL